MRPPLRKQTRRPRLEALERRDVPATWGIPWPQADHLTLSFMPDGSSVRGQASQLFGTLDAQLGAGKWESAILDAFQTWAANSNINVGQVADGGQPLGVAGPAQGDARFGDIRVSAVPLPAGVVAITAPHDPGTGTVSGDMILNSNADFGSAAGYDLFTVALHEAGHSFGFADSGDPSSFMYDVYTAPRAGLKPGAVPALQALYGGPRDLDARDGGPDASDPRRPVDVTALIAAAAGANDVAGDLGAIGTADYYQFKAPAPSPTAAGVDVQVQTAGISQLAPRVAVFDSSGNLVASSVATGDDGVTIRLPLLVAGRTYYIRVDAPSNDLHSVGSYVLSLAPTVAITSNAAGMRSATPLEYKVVGSQVAATGSGQVAATSQVNYYSFTTPASNIGGFTAQLQAFGVGLTAPQLVVLNGLGAVVGQATAGNPTNPSVTVRVPLALPNSKYYLKVTNGVINSSQFGVYQVAVSAGTAAAPAAPLLQAPWLGSAGVKLSTPNTSPANPATLQTPAGYAKGSFYAAMQGIGAPGVANYFRITPPATAQPAYMTVAVQALNGSSFVPWVTVADPAGNAVPARVLTQAGGISVVQVPYNPAAQGYVVKVAASAAEGGGSTGNYYLTATFGGVASSLATLASGTLGVAGAGSAVAGVAATVTTPAAQLYQFVLTGDPTNQAADALLRLRVIDSAGNVVATLTTLAAEAASLNVLLDAGRYSILVDAYSPSGTATPALKFNLGGTNLTDPIRAYSPYGGGASSTR